MVAVATTGLTSCYNAIFIDGVKLQRRMHSYTAETGIELFALNNRGQKGLHDLSLVSTKNGVNTTRYSEEKLLFLITFPTR